MTITKHVSVWRRACLPEDEGRPCLVWACLLENDALAWIAAQQDQYFKPEDYYLEEPVAS